jgi:hypothetical protein
MTSRSDNGAPFSSARIRAARAEAARLSKARKGPPFEYDLPPARALPGKRVKILDGQLDLDGNEYGR